MKLKDFVLILLIGVVAGFLAYHISFKKQAQKTYVPVEVPIIKRDTIWVEKIKKITQPARIETLITKEKDTISIAKTDTIFTDDSLTLNIDYYFPPLNKFEIFYQLKSPMIKEVIKEVQVERTNPYLVGGLIVQTFIIILILLNSLFK
jgi:hypothetical protein